MRCFFFCLFVSLLPVLAEDLKSKPIVLQTTKKLIFLDFYNEASDANMQFLSNSFGDGVDAAIKNKYRYAVIPSATWKKYAADKNWQPRDFADVKKIREMGRDLGADGVIYGRFLAKSDAIEIQGVIFSVVDGEIIGEERGTAKPDSTMFGTVQSLSGKLAVKIKDLFVPSDRGALWRAAVLPGWGHFYKERKSWGYFWAVSTGTAFVFTLTATTVFLLYRSEYKSFSPEAYRNSFGHVGLYDETQAQAEFDRLENRSNTWGDLAFGGLVTTAVFYAANIAHAWFIKADTGNIDAPSSAFQFRLDREYAGGIFVRIDYVYRWDE
jgi:TolB-like protein